MGEAGAGIGRARRLFHEKCHGDFTAPFNSPDLVLLPVDN